MITCKPIFQISVPMGRQELPQTSADVGRRRQRKGQSWKSWKRFPPKNPGRIWHQREYQPGSILCLGIISLSTRWSPIKSSAQISSFLEGFFSSRSKWKMDMWRTTIQTPTLDWLSGWSSDASSTIIYYRLAPARFFSTFSEIFHVCTYIPIYTAMRMLKIREMNEALSDNCSNRQKGGGHNPRKEDTRRREEQRKKNPFFHVHWFACSKSILYSCQRFPRWESSAATALQQRYWY